MAIIPFAVEKNSIKWIEALGDKVEDIFKVG